MILHYSADLHSCIYIAFACSHSDALNALSGKNNRNSESDKAFKLVGGRLNTCAVLYNISDN